ncbi:hypothetical protein K488DRAFT_89688 [Vararia minispora EC-137]|uniref:Uncharacterized protein n=1 Tax=Vararia minispora EC-137 TaxID=1314806 RepID=A0ACB8QA97_9AGAM|nr:hypothetical protein K488DRAFT_89688 [Vararia minispora EC-137]
MAALPQYIFDSHTGFTAPPSPGWTFGEKVDETGEGRAWLEGDKAGWKFVEPEKEAPVNMYKLLVSGIVPRPIAFVSSESAIGVQNLAPFSWFNMVTFDPPTVSISILNSRGQQKDTTANIRATKQFVVNIISEPFIHQANATSIEAPEQVSEWVLSGLTQEASTFVKPPRVKESAFAMECELYDIIDIKHPGTGAANAALVLGLIKGIHVRKDVLNDKGLVDPFKLRSVSRMGDVTYARVGDAFRIARPGWAEGEEAMVRLGKA